MCVLVMCFILLLSANQCPAGTNTVTYRIIREAGLDPGERKRKVNDDSYERDGAKNSEMCSALKKILLVHVFPPKLRSRKLVKH